MVLYKDDLSYIEAMDAIYGVAMTPEHKVELNDIKIENDIHGGCTGIYGKRKSDYSLKALESRIKESEWFIQQLCEVSTRHEKNLDALSSYMKELWISITKHDERADESHYYCGACHEEVMLSVECPCCGLGEKNQVLDDFVGWLKVHYQAAKMVNAEPGYAKACAAILAELNRLREGTDDRPTGDS